MAVGFDQIALGQWLEMPYCRVSSAAMGSKFGTLNVIFSVSGNIECGRRGRPELEFIFNKINDLQLGTIAAYRRHYPLSQPS